MISQFFIRNYRQHEKLTIKFDPHFNIISGENLNGKTNIFRALRSLLFLIPLSENDFPRNTDIKEIYLEALFQDNSKLSRSYSKSKQLIIFINSEGVEYKYTSISLAIEEIPKLIKFNYLYYGKTKLNLNFYEARQSLLLVHNTSTELYKLLSAFYGFETFASTLNKCNSDISSSTKNLTNYRSTLDTLQESLKNSQNSKLNIETQLRLKQDFLSKTKQTLLNIKNLTTLRENIDRFISDEISNTQNRINKLYRLLLEVDKAIIIVEPTKIDLEYCPTCGKKID